MKYFNVAKWLLFYSCLLVHASAYSEISADVVQIPPQGTINWTQGIVSCDGIAVPQDKGNAPEAIANARRDVIRNLTETVKDIRVAQTLTVGAVMASDPAMAAKMQQIAAQTDIVNKTVTKQKLRITVHLSLYNGFAQLFLPQDIQQIESIKAVAATPAPSPATAATASAAIAPEPDTFSGLIVDARGLGLKPALAPRIYDENGRQVYGPAFISREFAVAHGVCGYATSIEQASNDPRVVARPLLVKGLRITADATDVIISNMDASKIRARSEHLTLLKTCRVVMVVD